MRLKTIVGFTQKVKDEEIPRAYNDEFVVTDEKAAKKYIDAGVAIDMEGKVVKDDNRKEESATTTSKK